MMKKASEISDTAYYDTKTGKYYNWAGILEFSKKRNDKLKEIMLLNGHRLLGLLLIKIYRIYDQWHNKKLAKKGIGR